MKREAFYCSPPPGRSRGFCGLLVACGLALLLTACAPPAEVSKRFFWPIGHSEPKIEYLGFYQSDRDVTRGKENRVLEAVAGLSVPEPLFKNPFDVASNGRGLLFVSEPISGTVVVLDLVGRKVRRVLPSAGSEFFMRPMGLDVSDEGWLYVTDPLHGKVFVFDEAQSLVRSIGKGVLTRPVGIEVDAARDRIYVVDAGGHQIVVFDHAGQHLFSVGKRGYEEGEFNGPLDIAVADNGFLFVLDALNARVQVFDSDGQFVRRFGERGTALGSFQMPKAIAADSSGHIYVTDSLGHRFVIFDLEGRYLLTVGEKYAVYKGVAPGGLNLPEGIDADSEDSIWVVDSLNKLIHRFQYLNESFLGKNPIRPEQMFQPPGTSVEPK